MTDRLKELEAAVAECAAVVKRLEAEASLAKEENPLEDIIAGGRLSRAQFFLMLAFRDWARQWIAETDIPLTDLPLSTDWRTLTIQNNNGDPIKCLPY